MSFLDWNMSAPSKANINKPANPARLTDNHRHGTELFNQLVKSLPRNQFTSKLQAKAV